MGEVTLSQGVKPDKFCPAPMCKGWQGHVTYIIGESRTYLPVREGCAALALYLATDGEMVEDCPLHSDGQERTP